MTKTVEKILNNAYESIEAVIEYEQNDKEFAKLYTENTFAQLDGYISILYRFGTMSESDMGEAYNLVSNFRLKLSEKYHI